MHWKQNKLCLGPDSNLRVDRDHDHGGKEREGIAITARRAHESL